MATETIGTISGNIGVSSSSISSSRSSRSGGGGGSIGGGKGGSRTELITSGRPSVGGRSTKGLSFYMGGFFIVAQLAGAGFVSLPEALANTGWLGVPLLLLFCGMVGFSATRLGHSWVMLEQRWDYSKPARQPYMEIAHRAFGKWGRRITLFCVVMAQFGGTTVFIILIAEMLFYIIPSLFTCPWVLIVGAIMTPFTWLGTPKDFWQGPVLAVVSTVVACTVIVVQVLIDQSNLDILTRFDNPTVKSFSTGYAAILFAFGGSSVFPTIQNDMKNRGDFWKSVTLGFCCILCLYVPVSISGYAVFGTAVDSNILFAVSKGVAVQAAMALQIVNLLGSYVIGFNTISQAAGDIFKIPTNFTWKRVVLRSTIVWMQVLICLAIPDFSLILHLIGGSTMTMCSFILPPLMYLRLANTGPKHTQRYVPTWEKIALIEIVVIGTIGGLLSTITAIHAIVTTPFSTSCFMEFIPSTNNNYTANAYALEHTVDSLYYAL